MAIWNLEASPAELSYFTDAFPADNHRGILFSTGKQSSKSSVIRFDVTSCTFKPDHVDMFRPAELPECDVKKKKIMKKQFTLPLYVCVCVFANINL